MTKKIVKTAFAFQALSPHAQIGAFWPFWYPISKVVISNLTMIFKIYKISNLSEILYVPYSECVYFKSGIGF